MSTEQIQQFLRELTDLTQKHGIVIRACGCCQSPWLENAALEPYTSSSTIAEDLRYTEGHYIAKVEQ